MMDPDRGQYQYWCTPAIDQNGDRIVILFRKRFFPVRDTGWTCAPADDSREGPERVAYRPAKGQRWRKYDQGWFPVDPTKQLYISEEDALAVILMTKR